MVFVGYSNSHKGYRLIDLKTHKLFVSRYVRFDDMMSDDEDEIAVDSQFNEFHDSLRRDHELELKQTKIFSITEAVTTQS